MRLPGVWGSHVPAMRLPGVWGSRPAAVKAQVLAKI
jgi:hypothetical protein